MSSVVPPPPLQRYDFLYKVILIGDPSVGKTNLTIRFCDGAYSNTYVGTIGIDFKVRTLSIDGKMIKLQIWDTAGQERFQTITRVYYRGTMGVMFVYDITDHLSFEHLQKWMKAFKDESGDDAQKMIIGNKSDKYFNRKVDYEDAERVAAFYGCKLFETSAKTGYNVESAFIALARDIKQKHERKLEAQSLGNDQRNGNQMRRRKKSIFSKCSIL